MKNLDKGKKSIEKEFFLNNTRLFFSAREKVINNFKSRLFPVKKVEKLPTCEPTVELATEPTKQVRKLKMSNE